MSSDLDELIEYYQRVSLGLKKFKEHLKLSDIIKKLS